MILILIPIVVALFVAGYLISERYFKTPLVRILIGILIGVGLCALAQAIVFAGCALIWKG